MWPICQAYEKVFSIEINIVLKQWPVNWNYHSVTFGGNIVSIQLFRWYGDIVGCILHYFYFKEWKMYEPITRDSLQSFCPKPNIASQLPDASFYDRWETSLSSTWLYSLGCLVGCFKKSNHYFYISLCMHHSFITGTSMLQVFASCYLMSWIATWGLEVRGGAIPIIC